MNQHHLPWDVLRGAVPLEQVAGALRHVRECCVCAQELRATEQRYAELTALAEPVSPPPMLRERLLHSLAEEPRLGRFTAPVAHLLDVPLDTARSYLNQIDEPLNWQHTPFDGVARLPIHGGPALRAAVTHFVRVKPGKTIPMHEHLGHETALILQGRSSGDAGQILGPGDEDHAEFGSRHALHGLPGVDCVMLVVAHGGVRFAQLELLPI